MPIGSTLPRCSLLLVMLAPLHGTWCAQDSAKMNEKINSLLFSENPNLVQKKDQEKPYKERCHISLPSDAHSNKGTRLGCIATSPRMEDDLQTQGVSRPLVGLRRTAVFQVSSFVIFPLTAFHPCSSVWQFHFYNSLNIQWFIITISRVILLFTFWHRLLVPNNKSINTHLK